MQFQDCSKARSKTLAVAKLLQSSPLFPKKTIIKAATKVEALTHIGREWGHENLYIKREDQTSGGYGGNKVRNLEYLLGRAELLGAKTLVTPAPLGSNFVAALSFHANRLGHKVLIDQFLPHKSEQMIAHHEFSMRSGSEFISHDLGHHYLAAGWSFLRSKIRDRSRGDAMYISPGGSSIYGALGHVGAAFELGDQMRGHMPAYIVVGVGTCGTIAGLLAGLRLQGLSTKVVGVRCVDRVVANRPKIAFLANSVLRFLGSTERIKIDEIYLMNPPGAMGRYGESAANALEVKNLFKSENEITLDSTYTSKVVLGLREFLKCSEARGQSVLYWHTYTEAMTLN